MKIRVVYLNIEEGKPPVEIEIFDNLQWFYKLIGTKDIYFCHRRFGDREYLVIADDVGYFRKNPKFSAISSEFGRMPLVGNLIICGIEDRWGNMTDLMNDDVKRIMSHVVEVDGRYRFRDCD